MRSFCAVLVMSLGLLACSEDKGSSSSNSSPVDPLNEKVFFYNFTGPNGEVMIDAYQFKSPNKIRNLRIMKAVSSNVITYRQFVGTYSKDGETYSVTYPSRTCANDKSDEKLRLGLDSEMDRMAVQRESSPGVTVMYKDGAKYGVSGFSFAQIDISKEDVACSNQYLTKLGEVPSNDRAPASAENNLKKALRTLKLLD